MTRPRISIGRLMLAVFLVGFHVAVVCTNQPIFGLRGLEIGLLPGVTTLALLIDSARRRGWRSRPFARGFGASLTLAMGVYVVGCLTIPDVVRWPFVYYANYIEPRLFDDVEHIAQYWISLEIGGLILGLPQLLVALAGGLMATGLAGVSRQVPSPLEGEG